MCQWHIFSGEVSELCSETALKYNDMDIWEIYRDYIEGKKEISECNAAAAGNMDYAVIE